MDESPYCRVVHVQDSATAATFATTAWGAAFRSTITDPINVQPVEEAHAEQQTDNTLGKGTLGLNSKTFTIHVFPGSAEYSHKRAVSQSPLHGPWPKKGAYETFISAALRRSVPGGHLAPGFRDWDTGNQLSEDPAGFEAEGAESLLGRSTKRRAFFYQERRRKIEADVPDVMRSLAAVAEAVPPAPPRRTASVSRMAHKQAHPSQELFCQLISSEVEERAAATKTRVSGISPEESRGGLEPSTLDQGHNVFNGSDHQDSLGAEQHEILAESCSVESSDTNLDTTGSQKRDRIDEPAPEDSKSKIGSSGKGARRVAINNERISPSAFHKLFNGS